MNGNCYADWLTVRPEEGIIEAGITYVIGKYVHAIFLFGELNLTNLLIVGASVQIKVSALATVRLVNRLTTNVQRNVGATLIFRVDGGEDLYLFVLSI